MQQSEFDRFADEYQAQHSASIRLSGEDPAYFARYKARDAAQLTRGKLPRQAVLDFGAGVGNALPFLKEEFSDCELAAVDVSARSLEIAAARYPGIAQLRHFDGVTAPFDDGAFGLVFTACVFHHIEPKEHVEKLAEIRRLLSPEGWLVLYEHNPWNPFTVRAVRTCEFDEHAQLISAPTMKRRALLAGFRDARVYYRVFFPALLSALRPLEPMLKGIPLGAQYCLVCRK